MRRALLIAALSAVAAGCQRAPVDAAADATVLARVNGAEISLAGLGAAGAAGSREAMRAALERTIERELLVQRALELHLDRDPSVAASLDAARRRVLAEAYVERLAGAGRASLDEVQAFYDENRPLFAERRIYRLRELVVAAPAELVEVLRAETARAARLDEVAGWLRSRDASFSAVSLVGAAEELPLAYVPRLARMQAGEIAVFPRPAAPGFAGGASVIQVESAEAAPLSEAQAAPMIERFLAGRKRLQTAAAEVRRLRQAARIEYTAQFNPRSER